MSEALTNPGTYIAPPSQSELRVGFMEDLRNASLEVDTSTAIYPSENIGVPSQAGDVRIDVVAEVAVPDGANEDDQTYRHVAILKATRPDGKIAYALQGLIPGEDGTMQRSSNRAERIGTSGPQTIIGRAPNLNQKEQVNAVTSEDLWGTGWAGHDVSRRHVGFSVSKTGTVLVEDMSLNGTKIIAKEVAPTTRNDVLFAPVAAADEVKLSEEDAQKQMDAFVNGTLEADLAKAAKPEDTNVRRRVTPESEREAASAVMLAAGQDEHIAGILNAHTAGLTPFEVPGAVRTNAALRLALGEYFLQKFRELGSHVPDNVATSSTKSSRLPAYHELAKQLSPQKIHSNEYTALIALAMLDGTFDAGAAKSEPIQYDPITAPNRDGQHRTAAKMVLYDSRYKQ